MTQRHHSRALMGLSAIAILLLAGCSNSAAPVPLPTSAISTPLASTEPEEDLSAWQVEMIACLADQGWEAAGDGQNGSVSPRADLTGDDSVQYGMAAEECIERLAPPN